MITNIIFLIIDQQTLWKLLHSMASILFNRPITFNSWKIKRWKENPWKVKNWKRTQNFIPTNKEHFRS